MIDRHYGHLARDGREHAIQLLDQLNTAAVDAGGRWWTLTGGRAGHEDPAERTGSYCH